MTFDEAAKLLKKCWRRSWRYPAHGCIETKWYHTYGNANNDTDPVAFGYYAGRAASSKVEIPEKEATAVFHGAEAEYLLDRCGSPYGAETIIVEDDDE